MSDNIESILDQFPHSTIEKFTGEPKYYSIKEVEKKLIRNTSSIPSELGGGNHGYFGLISSAEKYQTITGHNFEPHVNPGTFFTFPTNATQPILAQTTSTHKEKLRAWRHQQPPINSKPS